MLNVRIHRCFYCSLLYALLGTLFIVAIALQLFGYSGSIVVAVFPLLYRQFSKQYSIVLLMNTNNQLTVVLKNKTCLVNQLQWISPNYILLGYHKFGCVLIERKQLTAEQDFQLVRALNSRY